MTGSPHSRRWTVLALLSSVFFLTVLDGTVMLAALPAIDRDLDPDPDILQWTVTAYAVAYAGLLLLAGRVADRFGPRRVLLAGVAARLLASLLCGVAWSGEVLLLGRVLQGVSAAVVAPAALALVVAAFAEGPDRNRALGVWAGVGGAGATAGLLLGGVVTDVLGWQAVFLANVPVALAVLLMAPALLRGRERTTARRLDVTGAAIATAALVLVILAVVELPQSGWTVERTLVPLVAGGTLAGVFVVVERRSRSPLVPVRLLRSRTVVGGNLTALAAGMAVDGMLVVLTGFVQVSLGWSAGQFGLVAAVMTIASVGGGLLGQRAVSAAGLRPVAVVGGVLTAAGCIALSRATPDASSLGLVVAGMLVFGAGLGSAFVASQIAALSGAGETDSGMAAGLADTSFSVGNAMGIAVCTSVLVASTSGGGLDAAAVAGGYQAAFLTAGGLALAGVLVAPLLPTASARRRGAVPT